MDEFEKGYPNLAAFSSSDEMFALYRRFGYLQSRLLLEKQDVLRVLENRLNEYDDDHIAHSNTRSLRSDRLKPREELLREVEQAFNSYGKARMYYGADGETDTRPATLVASSQQLMASNRPSASEWRSVYTYINHNKPLVNEELEYIQYKDDLITLRPGRDHAWLDNSIERVLRSLPPFINVSTLAQGILPA